MLSLDGYCMLVYCDSWNMMGISSSDLHHWCRLLSKFCRLSLKTYGEDKMTWEDKAHFSRSCVSCKDLARYLASLNKNEWWQRTWWQQMNFLDDFGFSVSKILIQHDAAWENPSWHDLQLFPRAPFWKPADTQLAPLQVRPVKIGHTNSIKPREARWIY